MVDRGTTSHGSLLDRVAGGPISWGICEVPGWGVQLPVDRVLSEMRELGLTATELGAIGWLPTDPDELRATLDAHGMRAIGRLRARRRSRPGPSRRDGAGGRRGSPPCSPPSAPTTSSPRWSTIPTTGRARRSTTSSGSTCSTSSTSSTTSSPAHGLRQVVHPHVDTLVETADELDRFLAGSRRADLPRHRPPHDRRRRPRRARRSGPPTGSASSTSRTSASTSPRASTPASSRSWAPSRPACSLRSASATCRSPTSSSPSRARATTGLYVLEQDVAITGGEPPPGEGPVHDVATSIAYLRSLEPAVRRGPGAQHVHRPPQGGTNNENPTPSRADGRRRTVAGRRRLHGRRRRQRRRGRPPHRAPTSAATSGRDRGHLGDDRRDRARAPRRARPPPATPSTSSRAQT